MVFIRRKRIENDKKRLFLKLHVRNSLANPIGWGDWGRTSASRIQSPMPYHLATPQ